MLAEGQSQRRAAWESGARESFPPVRVDREISGTDELYTGKGAKREGSEGKLSQGRR